MNEQLHTDTIVAVATPPGTGGIAVVRVSGPQAIDITSQRWQGAPIEGMTSHTAHLGHIVDAQSHALDEVVLTLYRAPHSYTGEDVVELSCHGSRWIQQQLVTTLIDAGCRMAEPGEFTRRAFASGRMDLSQAEAVADLIAATSAASHRVAMNQMRGQFSERLGALRDQLLHFVALIELELDFSEEDVTFAPRNEVVELAQNLRDAINQLADTFHQGNAIKNGLPVAIVGPTNAGKSTLLNALLHDDRALVSDVHGTTRDLIEDTITLGGTLIRFIDTAGLRDTTDVVEAMGIERTLRAIGQAQLVLWVVDAATPCDQLAAMAQPLLSRLENRQLIAIVNKSDAAPTAPVEQQLAATLPTETPIIAMSAHNPQHIKQLEDCIVRTIALPTVDDEAVVVTNVRHYEALRHAGEAISRALDALRQGLSGDLVSQDIRECMHHLGTITGQITTPAILEEIFTHFCIGK